MTTRNPEDKLTFPGQEDPAERERAMHDPVNHPPHYTQHPSGVECIEITEHMGFCLGNAVKYIWRADLKHDAVEDLKKAIWYIERELHRREAEQTRAKVQAHIRADTPPYSVDRIDAEVRYKKRMDSDSNSAVWNEEE